MPCPEFEELLAAVEPLAPADRERLELHLTHCESCRAWSEASAEADAALRAVYSGLLAPASLAATVRRQAAASLTAPRVSSLPEILDFIAWAGVLAAGFLAAWFWLPPGVILSPVFLLALGAVLLITAFSAAMWAFHRSEV